MYSGEPILREFVDFLGQFNFERLVWRIREPQKKLEEYLFVPDQKMTTSTMTALRNIE